MEASSRAEIEQHQLDYDWHFTSSSTAKIADLVRGRDSVLLLGCPSLAATLSDLGLRGHLVERNPNYQGVSDRFTIAHTDLRFCTPPMIGSPFDACIADPPWYPHELLHWVSVGLSHVRNGGSVFFTLWPEHIRPSAAAEYQEIFNKLVSASPISRVGTVEYELPFFERISAGAAKTSAPDRIGLVVRVTKEGDSNLEVPPFVKTNEEWFRFTLSGEQLAIKVDEQHDTGTVDSFAIAPVTLRNTSRREAILPAINIWTSRNRVARLASPKAFLRRLLSRDPEVLRILSEKLNMSFDPNNVHWGVSWRHRA